MLYYNGQKKNYNANYFPNNILHVNNIIFSQYKLGLYTFKKVNAQNQENIV